ncbi:MAG: multidrug efflux SMR transporter [Pseudobdellovibrionaceae bacterium]
MAWIYLLIAGLLEIAWAIGMKQSEGFTKLIPSLWTIGLMILSFGLLSQAVRVLPIGTGYAIWTGIGAVGTAIAGILFFGESKDLLRIGFILFILIGIIGLKWTAKS